jgi:hypothetical protein
MARHAAAALAAVLSAAAFAPGQAPPGYKTFENKSAPVTFHYPVLYDEMPLPPTEQVTVAKFLLKAPPEELKRLDERAFAAAKPQLFVFHFAVGAATTGGGEAKGDGKGPSNLREQMEAQNKVTSWAQFTARFRGVDFAEDAKKPGFFTLSRPGPDGGPLGFMARKEQGGEVFGVYGVGPVEYHKPLQTQVQRVGQSLKPASDAANEFAEESIERLYGSGRYRAVEARKKARAELAKGWKALDTENYLIVHHSKNEALVKRIARDIEAMRGLYMELFPPTGPMDRLAIVRICRTKEEYHQYGGPPNSGGFWHPGNEELVFFDYSYTMKTLDDDEKRKLEKANRTMTNDDSLLVLYHEAFHQYIHYAVGEFAPHDWFNEGYGDYFSGAEIGDGTGKVLRVDPSPWRIHLAKDMCEFGKDFVPLEQILKAERAQFYNPARIRFFYAGAWSFVYFLKQAKEAQVHPKWSRILATYFESMKADYPAELGKFGSAPTMEHKAIAGAAVRKLALRKALDGVDVPELEKVWRQWVVDMKDPWPNKRAKPPKPQGGK